MRFFKRLKNAGERMTRRFRPTTSSQRKTKKKVTFADQQPERNQQNTTQPNPTPELSIPVNNENPITTDIENSGLQTTRFVLTRHAFSCNNVKGKKKKIRIDSLNSQVFEKDAEPSLTIWGILQTLEKSEHHIYNDHVVSSKDTEGNNVDVEGNNVDVDVSVLIRTWQTAVLLYLPHMKVVESTSTNTPYPPELHLNVKPYLKEKNLYIKSMDKGNMPLDFDSQIKKMKYFFELLLFMIAKGLIPDILNNKFIFIKYGENEANFSFSDAKVSVKYNDNVNNSPGISDELKQENISENVESYVKYLKYLIPKKSPFKDKSYNIMKSFPVQEVSETNSTSKNKLEFYEKYKSLLAYMKWALTYDKVEDSGRYVVCHSKIMEQLLNVLNNKDVMEHHKKIKHHNSWDIIVNCASVKDGLYIKSIEIHDGVEPPPKIKNMSYSRFPISFLEKHKHATVSACEELCDFGFGYVNKPPGRRNKCTKRLGMKKEKISKDKSIEGGKKSKKNRRTIRKRN
mgnify:CR=1 FL=1